MTSTSSSVLTFARRPQPKAVTPAARVLLSTITSDLLLIARMRDLSMLTGIAQLVHRLADPTSAPPT